MPVTIIFETGFEDRFSKEYGPFEYVQLTYDSLRVSPDGEHLATFCKDGWWRIDGDDEKWSDIVIF